MTDLPAVELIHVAPTAVSFVDFQAIHQQQQRRRYPEQPTPKPETADSWKVKVQRWAAVVVSGLAGGLWFGPGYRVTWLVLVTLFTVLGLAHQWWEYRRAYRQDPVRQRPTSFVVEQAGVHVTQNGMQRFFSWAGFYSVQPVGNWLLLYTSPEHCYYLNLDLVQPPATAAQVLALLPTPGKSAD
ncbi:hypothetical protein [Hymenobacter cellulosilyticus]|uniref:YcxB family protein n=1 Tax=Hymenobacter cellulosilyticus TaxID=2932248 RepID=A0A8T9QAK2_9BACT|nr:hypothetical protein [Hymenobacter cellulosilyticus]UOQ74606.1 hypothetical protein MUN79_12475 [Hymenobacter cellulosilyticus]